MRDYDPEKGDSIAPQPTSEVILRPEPTRPDIRRREETPPDMGGSDATICLKVKPEGRSCLMERGNVPSPEQLRVNGHSRAII